MQDRPLAMNEKTEKELLRSTKDLCLKMVRTPQALVTSFGCNVALEDVSEARLLSVPYACDHERSVAASGVQ